MRLVAWANSRLMRRSFVTFVLAAAVAGFALFSYNSGLGYDALEYLVIGRGLAEGAAIDDFIPSKGWALYALLGGVFRLHPGAGRWTVAGLTAVVAVTVAVLSGRVARELAGRTAGWLAAGLTFVAAAFMEMNFLETEGFVAGFGLLGFLAALRGTRASRPGAWMFVAGGLFAIGFAFKSVAAIFPAATFLWLCLPAGEARSIRRRAFDVCTMGAGFAFLVVLPFTYFSMSGRGSFFREWYVRFPLIAYEGSSEWFPKVWTKLLWFIVTLAATALLSLRPETRRRLGDGWAVLGATILGILALLPLYKSQASHYFFPAAAFLLPVTSAVFLAALGRGPGGTGRAGVVVAAGGALAVAITLSAISYRPDVFRRLTTVRTFPEDHSLRQAADELQPESGRLLSFGNSQFLYWVTGRRPNLPVLYYEGQTHHWWLQHPGAFRSALSDPRLTLVEYSGQLSHGSARWRAEDSMARLRSEIEPVLSNPREWERVERNATVFWRRIGNPKEGS